MEVLSVSFLKKKSAVVLLHIYTYCLSSNREHVQKSYQAALVCKLSSMENIHDFSWVVDFSRVHCKKIFNVDDAGGKLNINRGTAEKQGKPSLGCLGHYRFGT